MSRLAVGFAVLAPAAVAFLSCSSEPAYPSHAQLLDPQSCQPCHADHYRDWSTSMHAYSSDDPVLQAAIALGQRQTNGAVGALCVTCHAPMAAREGATTDGTNLASLPKSLRGVTCFYCHSVDAVHETQNGAVHLASDGVMRGPYSDPVPTNGHRSAYSTLHDRDQANSARLCGACHDLRVGTALIERTYTEWEDSVFAQGQGGASCGQCHMSRSSHEKPIAQAPGARLRRYHAHDVPALDVSLLSADDAAEQKSKVQALLDTTLQSAICVGAGSSNIEVILDNVAAGHMFPSGGAQHRRAWVEVVAYSGGQIIYQSGVIPDGTPISAVKDADRWEMRECLLDDKGVETLLPWSAVGYEEYMLPAQSTFDPRDPAYYKTHVRRSFPRAAVLPAAPDRVTMRVRVQPIALEILDALIGTGDLDPALRSRMPIFDTARVEWTPATSSPGYVNGGILFTCVSTSNLDFRADRVEALKPNKCAPQ